jgi:hypothetical protein
MKITKRQSRKIINESLRDTQVFKLPYDKRIIRRDNAHYEFISKGYPAPGGGYLRRVKPVSMDPSHVEKLLKTAKWKGWNFPLLSPEEIVANYDIYDVYETTAD